MLVMNSCRSRWTESIGNRYNRFYDPTRTLVKQLEPPIRLVEPLSLCCSAFLYGVPGASSYFGAESLLD